jgi:hypothetical protein
MRIFNYYTGILKNTKQSTSNTKPVYAFKNL